MIKTDAIFDVIDEFSCIWVPTSVEAPDLAKISNIVIVQNKEFLSLPIGAIGRVWPWLEHSKVKLLTRLEFDFKNDTTPDMAMSELATKTTEAFRHGASGAQIFVHINNIPEFVKMILPLRDDLFFERYLSVAINIDEIKNGNVKDVLELLAKIKPDSVLVIADGDSFDPKSDFVGRIFGMLENWGWDFALHIMFGGNMMRVSQVLRLVQRMQPKLISDLRVFIIPPQE
ncbi:MAG: hypothetical protein J5742_00355 [Alphaproteobacteria bacterium]|nr:hypothetical protein [Alphaproteobacteria bacterium]